MIEANFRKKHRRLEAPTARDLFPEAAISRDRITVPEKDAEHPAINRLPVSPEVYITDVAFKDTIGKEIISII